MPIDPPLNVIQNVGLLIIQCLNYMYLCKIISIDITKILNVTKTGTGTKFIKNYKLKHYLSIAG